MAMDSQEKHFRTKPFDVKRTLIGEKYVHRQVLAVVTNVIFVIRFSQEAPTQPNGSTLC